MQRIVAACHLSILLGVALLLAVPGMAHAQSSFGFTPSSPHEGQPTTFFFVREGALLPDTIAISVGASIDVLVTYSVLGTLPPGPSIVTQTFTAPAAGSYPFTLSMREGSAGSITQISSGVLIVQPGTAMAPQVIPASNPALMLLLIGLMMTVSAAALARLTRTI
ncbi:hypothetical protein [Pseudomarimonas arenosa]|nr:hypothetical protein [Pseudomarimonas arenosa]